MLPNLERRKLGFWETKIIISLSPLGQRGEHALTTGLTLLHPLPLPPPSVSPPIVVPSPVGVGCLLEQLLSLCVTANLVDLNCSSTSATKFPDRLARDPTSPTISKSSNLPARSGHISIHMADSLSHFSMLGPGFNSQLVPNPNAAGPSQQQPPSESMQPIGGLPNPEHSRMWMQMQQQASQQRTTPSGDIVGSQVTSNRLFVTSLSLSSFSLPPFLPSFISHPFFATLRPSYYFFFLFPS